jgi:hypothetical protein
MKKTISIIGVVAVGIFGAVTLTSTDDYEAGDNICIVHPKSTPSDHSVAIRVLVGDNVQDFGVFDLEKQVFTNQEEYDLDPENVEPVYETVEQNYFTDYFGAIDWTNYTQSDLNEACKGYLNAKQGFNL